MVGHLQSLQSRTTDVGAMLIYEPNIEAIILDTSIFGSAFGEFEVLLDVTKIKNKPQIILSYN